MIDCMLNYLGAHAPALYTYDNRPLIAVSAIPSNTLNVSPDIARSNVDLCFSIRSTMTFFSFHCQLIFVSGFLS